jgi:hypothetical protein
LRKKKELIDSIFVNFQINIYRRISFRFVSFRFVSFQFKQNLIVLFIFGGEAKTKTKKKKQTIYFSSIANNGSNLFFFDDDGVSLSWS